MIRKSSSASSDFSKILWISSAPICTCQKPISFIGRKGYRRRNRGVILASMVPIDGRDQSLSLMMIANSMKRGLKNYPKSPIFNTIDEASGDSLSQDSIQLGYCSNDFSGFREDPVIGKLTTHLGVIHPMPLPPNNENIGGMFVLFFISWVVFDMLWTSRKQRNDEGKLGMWPQVPTTLLLFLEKYLRRKESVEWMNMVLEILWKAYRGGLENSVGTSQIRETYYDSERQNHVKTHMGENSSRANNDLMMENHHGSRVLPPSMRSSMAVPNAQDGCPSDLYRPSGVVDKQAVSYDSEWQNHVKTHMGKNSSRANNDLMKENHHGIRVLPPSMRSSMAVPNAQNGGPSDLYRPSGVVDEQVASDERHIYQVALQDFNQPLNEANLPDGLLSVSLLRHQKIALAWMIQKENSSMACSGGILADDQGLGKTISMIALIQNQKVSSKPNSNGSNTSKAKALKLYDDDVKPTGGSLVVCPASVLRQWARELDEKVTEEGKLEVLVYHGSNRTKDPAELARYDVVLTTYAIVAKEVPTKVFDEDDQRNGDWYGLHFAFGNKKRKGISGKKKKGSAIDCSGTLAKVIWLRVILDEAQMIKNSKTQMSKSCCGLRAKNRWCLSGTPMQNNVDELFSYFRFLKCDPYSNYKSFCSQIKTPISRDSIHGYMKLQAVLKAILLRRTKGSLIDGKPIINLPPKTINLTAVDLSPEERAFYQKLEAESRSRFKAYAAAGTVSQNYANILVMLLRLRQACDHPLLVEGFTSESVGKYSTRMAKNLPRYKQANLLNLLETLNICCLCSDPPEDAVVTLCGHVFCYQCVSEYLTGDDNTCPSPNCKSPIGPDVVFNKATLRNSISDDNGANSSRIDEKSIVLQQGYSSSKIKTAIEIIRKNCRSKSSYLVGCNGDASSSSGVEGPIKTIVFSQWTRMLDLIEMSLSQYGIEYRRLDGSMSLSSRDRAVKQFNTDPEVTVMLMSLKAGNLGLNMVAASHVILFDLWWNPTTEDQAIDRAHRIGQTRPVTVSRLTIKDTVEDRILALQDEKRKMVASAFGEDQGGTSASRLTPEDLRYLFMGER